MKPSQSKCDVRQVLYESTPRPGKRKLQVVFQRKAGVAAITLEKGTGKGDPWLAVPIKQVEALSRALVRAYKIRYEFERNDDLIELSFPIQLAVLRRKTGSSLSIVQELRVSIDEWESHHYIDLTVFQLEGEAWVRTSQRVTFGFADLESVHAALVRALRMTRNDRQVLRSSQSPGSRLDESLPPYLD